jgi:short chain dehydrogenase
MGRSIPVRLVRGYQKPPLSRRDIVRTRALRARAAVEIPDQRHHHPSLPHARSLQRVAAGAGSETLCGTGDSRCGFRFEHRRGDGGMGKLEGKVALVTGSGRNIGRATVLKLADEGAHVVVNARSNRQEAEAVAREARDLGVKAVPCSPTSAKGRRGRAARRSRARPSNNKTPPSRNGAAGSPRSDP